MSIPPFCPILLIGPTSILLPQEKIQTMFEQLALVDHPNIVKLHKYWLDASEARARVS